VPTAPALSEHFVSRNPYGGRKIEGSDGATVHGDGDESIASALADRSRMSRGLRSEKEHHAVGVGDVPDRSLRIGGNEVRLSEPGKGLLELFEAFPQTKRDPLPVVQPRSTHLLRLEGESERLHQVKRRPGGETGAPGVSGVPVDLRGYQDHVKIRHWPSDSGAQA
jgi:hypothetical protein